MKDHNVLIMSEAVRLVMEDMYTPSQCLLQIELWIKEWLFT